jgi:DNA-binding CsgD family transcriptional regulator
MTPDPTVRTPGDPARGPGFRPSDRGAAVRGTPAPGWRIPAPFVPGRTEIAPRPLRRTPSALNDKDRELLRHLADGRSTGQVAAAMAVSRNTARTRIRRVRGKLAAPDRGRIVGTARGLGLV